MRVLVLYGSAHIGERIIDRIAEIDNLTVVGGIHRAEESLQLINDTRPDLLILDAQLGKGGAALGLLRAMKSLTSPPPVIMTATSPYAQYRKQSMKEGADYFFQLPTEMEEFMQTIRQCTGSPSDTGPLPG